MRRSSRFSSEALAAAGLDSAITLQNSFQHFDTQGKSRLVFEQSNRREPGQLKRMPQKEEWPQIEARGGMEMLIEMDPRAIKVENARRAAAPPAGAFVFHGVTEVDTDAMAGLAEAQTEIDVGLALPIPAVESTRGAESFHIDQGATGMGRFHFDDARSRRRHRNVLKFFPQFQGLVTSGENPGWHQWLFVGALRLPLEICLPEVYPGPVSFSELGKTAREIARLEENIGINQEGIPGLDRSQSVV